MKEVLRPQPLTNDQHSIYPGVRGDIFMAENQGEGLKGGLPAGRPKPPEIPKAPAQPPTPSAEAEKAWKKVAGGELAPEQRWLAEQGISPVAGGAPTSESPEFAQKLRGILGEEIERSTFKTLLEKAEVIPIPRLYEDFLKTYTETRNRLDEELAGLLPETSENKLEVTVCRRAIERLDAEAKKITNLFVEAGVTREEGTTAEIREMIKEIERLEGEERRKAIKHLMDMDRFSPHDSPIPNEVLRLIISDEVLAEEFLSRLTVLPIEDEPHQIRSYWGITNEEKFIRLAPSIMRREKWEYLLDLRQANIAFHNMNYIIKRGFDQFGPQSEALLPKYFQLLSRIRGVDTILRLYEDFHQEALGVETEITEEYFKKIDELVEEEFKVAQGATGESLEDWERFRALIFGRNFFRILVRAAEHITLSELPEWGDPKLWTSLPQRQLTQILNILKFTGIRFRPGEALGGDIFLKEALKINSEVGKGKKENHLKTLQGTDVDMREFQGVIGSRGVLATWRNAEIVLEQIKFYDGERLTNIVDFFRLHKAEIEGIEDLPEGQRRARTEELFKDLIKYNSIALGILVSPSGLDTIARMPVALKEILWKRVAEFNPLVMASMLRRLEITDPDKRDVKSLEEILAEKWGTPDQKSAVREIKTTKRLLGEKQKELDKLTAKKADSSSLRADIDILRRKYSSQDVALKELFRDDRWRDLARKLRLANELRVNEAAKRLENKEGELRKEPKKLADFLSGELVLTPEEDDIVKKITENGKEIAPDLARIRQSYSWFLNDTPFKILNWMEVGTFYDRQTGDLAAFNKAAEEIIGIMSNPFGQPVDKILEHFSKAIYPEGAGRVIGVADAQDRQKPLFKAWLRLIYEKPLLRPKIISALLHAFRQPTSRAQEIVGPNAPAVNEDGMFDILDKALPMGILRQEVKDKETGKVKWKGTFNEFVKDFDVGVFKRLVWAKLRDYSPIVLIFLLVAFFNRVRKEKM